MIKTVLSSSYGFDDQVCRLVDVHSRGVDSAWMQKRAAAASLFADTDIQPEKNASIIHVIAMGDSEYYGGNRNADIFYGRGKTLHALDPEKKASVEIECGTADRCWTFEKYANVYRHHRNKNPLKREGVVKRAAHNDAAKRTELLISVDNDKWETELQKLASGSDIEMSMSCKVPYDYCTYCLNKAASRRTYCDHLKNNAGGITKSGGLIGAVNDHMTFFDISTVAVNADRIAFGLLKVASATRGVLAVDTAMEMGIYAPELTGLTASLTKLAEMEKEIEGIAKCDEQPRLTVLAIRRNLGNTDLDELGAGGPNVDSVLGAMADKGIVLDLPDFVRMLLGEARAESLEPELEQATGMLPGVFGRMLNQGCRAPFMLGRDSIPGDIERKITSLVPEFSINEADTEARVVRQALAPHVKVTLRIVTPDGEKSAAARAEFLADTYASYKAAAFDRLGKKDSNLLTLTAVIPHYYIMSKRT